MAIEAFLLAAFAQSSLLVSGLVVYRFTFSPKVIGCLAGFGAGALISAVSFDLIPEATELSLVESALGLIAGAAIFVVADRIVDGLPESLIFGIAVTTGDPISIAFVAAVWVSNVPQALAPSASLAKQAWSIGKTALMWGAVVLACAVTAVFGYVLGENVSAATGAAAAAVASGACWPCSPTR